MDLPLATIIDASQHRVHVSCGDAPSEANAEGRQDDEQVAPGFGSPERRAVHASRQIENFTDLAHFPWMHPRLFGDPSRMKVVAPEVSTDGRVLRYEFQRPEAKRSAVAVIPE